MAYNLTMLVGEVKPQEELEEDGKKFFQMRASVDLRKFGKDSDALSEDFEHKIYFYSLTDGNTEVMADKYGSTLRAIPIKDALAVMEHEWSHDSDGAREEMGPVHKPLEVACKLLKEMAKRKELSYYVVFYGS